MSHTSHAAQFPPPGAGRPFIVSESFPARGTPLDFFLRKICGRSRENQALMALIELLAKGAVQVAQRASLGSILVGHEVEVCTANHDGNVQQQLEQLAHEVFVEALRTAPVAAVLSEESAQAIALNSDAPLAVAIAPLEGSSDIDANVSIGTIFSIYHALPNADDAGEHFMRPGQEQIAAGFIIYGPQTSLVFSTGKGVHVFTFDRSAETFRLAIPRLAVPEESTEYAVDASNYRHWDNSVRTYIDDCMQGADGPLSRDYSMHWIASLVADAYRILIRGGVYLDPSDQRQGYGKGRLRLICEANPISFLVEQAGGGATNTVQRILEIRPEELHARTPFVFGSVAVVQRISRYHTDPQFSAERNPLFFSRGLIRR